MYVVSKQGIGNIILERVTGEYVLGRIRAGILEQGMVDLLREAGVSERMDAEGEVHDGYEISNNGKTTYINLKEMTGGKTVMCYGQVEVTRDLMAAREEGGWPTYYEASGVQPYNVTSEKPTVTFTYRGKQYAVRCDYIAGCDGYHGVSRQAIPQEKRTEHERIYPFGWLGVMSDTPPQQGGRECITQYSEIALRRVWNAERFSWWMSNMLHDYSNIDVSGMEGKTFSRFMESELNYYLDSEAGRKVMAEQNVGLPYEDLS